MMETVFSMDTGRAITAGANTIIVGTAIATAIFVTATIDGVTMTITTASTIKSARSRQKRKVSAPPSPP